MDEDFKLNNAYYEFEFSDGQVLTYPSWETVKSSQKIVKAFTIIFRDNRVRIPLPENTYIYFCFGLGKELTAENEAPEASFVIGWKEENSNNVVKNFYKVPEIILKTKRYADIAKCPERCLYYNGKGNKPEIVLPF